MATTKVRYNQIKTGLPAGGDVSYNDVELLLHMNGADGSTTFTDSSSASLTITNNGSVPISTDEFKFGGSSAYFDGNGTDYLDTGLQSSLNFQTDDFTIEFWVNISSHGGSTNPRLLTNWRDPLGFSTNMWSLHHDHSLGNEKISFFAYNLNTSAPILQSTTTISTSTWYHVAITRSGNTFRLFIDGTQEDSFTSTSSLDGSGTRRIYIGDMEPGQSTDGYIDELRVTSGTARYTSNFSVPTAAFPAFESKEGKELRVGANGTIELES